jgi:hypothetical protein
MEQLQRTAKWFSERLYKFTSSNIYKLLTEPQSKAAKEAGELSATAKKYILEKIAEELGANDPEFSSKATDWGNINEPLAKEWYEIKTGRKVGEVGFCSVDDFFGGSPDAAVWDPSIGNYQDQGIVNCALEIKCPYSPSNHLNHCLITDAEKFKAIAPAYYWQCVSHMMVLKVDYCDFVSFDPRINHELGLFIFRLEKNEDDVKHLQSKIDNAIGYKAQLKIQLGLL